MLSKSEKRLKIRVWLVSIGAFLIIVFTLLWSYKNFETINLSINQLSEPNEKLGLINNILQDFISSENNIQTYIITGNVAAAKVYEQQTEQTKKNIEQLRKLVAYDQVQLKNIDALQATLKRKIQYLNSFLVAKREREGTAFTELALERINANMVDPLDLRKEPLNPFLAEKEQQSITTREVVQRQDTANGFWANLKRLLGGNKPTFDTLVKQHNFKNDKTLTENRAVMTTTVEPNDSTLKVVRNILEKAGELETETQKNLSRKELALIRKDQEFMEEIKLIITDLQEKERVEASVRKSNSIAHASEATITIIIVGVAGVIFSGLLLLYILRDISKSSYFRRKLEVEKQRAENLAKVKEEFLANMSHEIRTPLNSILGFSGLMKSTALSKEQSDYLSAVNVSSDYLMQLINDVLDYTKIEAGKLELVNEPFSVDGLINDTKRFFELNAKSKSLDFTITKMESVPQWLTGDIFRIRQVINNLVSNALKFTKYGSVTIVFGGAWFKEVFYLNVEIKDTGVGIEQTKLKTIFEDYSQADAYIVGKFGGSGLGLSICKNLTDAMSGTLQVRSDKNVGSTFTLKIPLKKVENIKVNNVWANPVEMHHFKARVLMVEDDHWNALLLETILIRHVAEVKVFNDAESALGYLNHQGDSVDLLMTDIRMSKMNGDELVKKVKQLGLTFPIVALTAHADKKSESRLLKNGVDLVCLKPYTEDKIISVLVHLLGDKGATIRHKEVTKASDPLNPASLQLDLTEMRKFAGGDEGTFLELFAELIKNNEQQIDSFCRFLESQNWVELGALAHKMLPTYEHTKLDSVAELLKSIELYADLNELSRIKEVAVELKPKLISCHLIFKDVLEEQLNT
jgi:signal transduction histidine kinase/DNA-binding response OmpR family regulator